MTDSVTVTLIHTPARKFWHRDRRWQPYRWIAYSPNGKVLAESGEFYTNKADCVESIWRVFGTATDVWLKDGHNDLNPWALRKSVR